LVNAQTGNQIWGEPYNRKMIDLVSLQSEIARDVSQKLKTKLSGADEQRLAKNYTKNPEAYQLYLKGLYYWNKRTGEDLKQALTLFQQAIDQDPSYAKAYGGLAMTYEVFSSNIVTTKQEGSETQLKAKAAALKALELDNNLAEAYTVLAQRKIDDWDFAGADGMMKLSLK
jgi:Tfp pilus assembly protein PilF